MPETIVSVDAFDEVYRGARDAGIDPDSMQLETEEITSSGDVLIRISEEASA